MYRTNKAAATAMGISATTFDKLCRKHGVRPYRYPRQRRTTVMVRARQAGFERTVASEFRTLYRELTAYFDETVNHLIADAMKSDGDDETLALGSILAIGIY